MAYAAVLHPVFVFPAFLIFTFLFLFIPTRTHEIRHIRARPRHQNHLPPYGTISVHPCAASPTPSSRPFQRLHWRRSHLFHACASCRLLVRQTRSARRIFDGRTV
ncbi:hypothetical protein C8R44DRAFT_774377 [Mycena epipterygia]|nr:hypothetical protein C8R44DRAFT_774377 [Mycena epipterygia]